jgi:hypothetical protein
MDGMLGAALGGQSGSEAKCLLSKDYLVLSTQAVDNCVGDLWRQPSKARIQAGDPRGLKSRQPYKFIFFNKL